MSRTAHVTQNLTELNEAVSDAAHAVKLPAGLERQVAEALEQDATVSRDSVVAGIARNQLESGDGAPE